VAFSLCFILPLVLVVSASLTSEQVLTGGGGFSLIPRDFSLDAYASAFANKERMIRAYIVTAFQSVVGTFAACVVCGWIAYPLSRSNFRFKGIVTGIVFFTMLFGAGTIPNYIIFSRYYKIANSIWIYLLPGITGGAWNTMIFRTFFKSLPESLFE
jgi:putative aldouronate transport system permease protein